MEEEVLPPAEVEPDEDDGNLEFEELEEELVGV